MKMKTEKIKLLALASIVLGTSMFTSCEKDDNQMSQSFFEKSATASIPHYSTFDEISEIIDKVSTFETLQELLDYEKSQGRSSIGSISDEFYESIDKESFSNQDEVMNFYNENSNLLDTLVKKDEIYISTKYSKHSFRYVANQNGLFSVENCVFRLFKNSMVSTSEENLDKLLSLTEKDIETLDTTIFKVSQKLKIAQQIHSQCYYNDVCGGSTYDGNTKFEMELELWSIWPFFRKGPIIYTELDASNYNRFFGIWWLERYTTTINGSVTIHKKNIDTDTWERITKTININKKFAILDHTIYKDKNTNRMHNSFLNYHFESFNIKGRNLRVDYVTLQWN